MLRNLREYQWYQTAWNAGEEALAREKVRLQQAEEEASVSWADDLRSKVRGDRAEAAAERLLEAMAKEELFGSDRAAALWTSHERDWQAFEQRHRSQVSESTTGAGANPDAGEGDSEQVVGYDDIPWPPVTEDLLSAMAAMELSNRNGEGSQTLLASEATAKEAYVAHRRAFRKAQLRWHPDKFMHRFGKCTRESDTAAILAKLQELGRAINDAWSTINRTGAE